MAASTGAQPVTAPDNYGQPGQPGYLSCYGARSITLQITAQAVIFQLGIGNPPVFDGNPELRRLPVVDRVGWRCDALRFRAATPAAQLPAGSTQATVSIDTLP
jgi:hypothetical protein